MIKQFWQLQETTNDTWFIGKNGSVQRRECPRFRSTGLAAKDGQSRGDGALT